MRFYIAPFFCVNCSESESVLCFKSVSLKCLLSFRSWLPFVRANVCRPLQVSNDSTSLKSKIWSLDLNKIRKVVNFELSRWRKWDAFAFCRMCWDSGFPIPPSTKKQINKQNQKKCLLNFDLVFMVWLPTGLRPYNRSNTQLSCNHLSIHFPK